ncbi:MAG: carboxypeptidase regulatory-like domain-containing protein [Desulfobacteraceae bacterium]|nr:carboxypeptidase regulatory-like domain-containing protein [Desulfobacteraceae bacterium]
MNTVLSRVEIVLPCILLYLLFAASPAVAHKVNVFAYAEGGRLMVETYFADGKPVENAKIAVLSSDGRKLLEGTAAKDGTASFPVPAKDDLTIEVDASLGHKASFMLRKDDL